VSISRTSAIHAPTRPQAFWMGAVMLPDEENPGSAGE
jgi:hypothetical protein